MDWDDIVVGSSEGVMHLGNVKGRLSEVAGEWGVSFANFAKPA
jgi:hypothetical protein